MIPRIARPPGICQEPIRLVAATPRKRCDFFSRTAGLVNRGPCGDAEWRTTFRGDGGATNQGPRPRLRGAAESWQRYLRHERSTGPRQDAFDSPRSRFFPLARCFFCSYVHLNGSCFILINNWSNRMRLASDLRRFNGDVRTVRRPRGSGRDDFFRHRFRRHSEHRHTTTTARQLYAHCDGNAAFHHRYDERVGECYIDVSRQRFPGLSPWPVRHLQPVQHRDYWNGYIEPVGLVQHLIPAPLRTRSHQWGTGRP